MRPTVWSPCCKRLVAFATPMRAPEAAVAQCPGCLKPFELVMFPAMTAAPKVARAQLVPETGEDATCFFHATNQADAVCEACGRFLCSVCAVDFGGSTLCPACIAAKKANPARAASSRWLFDGIALQLALLPIIIFWPTTLLTAPAVLALVVYSWKKPGGVLPRMRWRFVLACLVALVQIAGWTFVFIMMARD